MICLQEFVASDLRKVSSASTKETHAVRGNASSDALFFPSTIELANFLASAAKGSYIRALAMLPIS